jgi:predicted site-specific integrase-resolvase
MTDILGVTAQTLRNWDKSGKLKPHHTSPNGYRYYSEDSLNQLLNKPVAKTGKVVGYCRVSSPKQKDDLERQIENMQMYLLAQGKPFEIISDIGSGINYKRKGLQELIKGMANRSINKVIVLYKDRLTRFGYELVEDLVQIVTVFSCKLQGKRANKAKKLIKELISDDTI